MSNDKEKIALPANQYNALWKFAKKFGCKLEDAVKEAFMIDEPAPLLCKDLPVDIIVNTGADCFIRALSHATLQTDKTIWEWFDKKKLYENPNQEVALYRTYGGKLAAKDRMSIKYNFKYINSRMTQILKEYGYLKYHTSKFRCTLNEFKREQIVIVLCHGNQGENSHYAILRRLEGIFSSFSSIYTKDGSYTFYIKKA